MTKPFTGWHMLAILIAMFGVIIMVNLIMVRAAISTFGGTVVENSYVASQRYNGWIAAARAQDRLGLVHRLTLDAERHIVITIADTQGPVDRADVTARATHPLGRTTSQAIAFDPAGNGTYRARAPLAPGRWMIRITARRGNTQMAFASEIAP